MRRWSGAGLHAWGSRLALVFVSVAVHAVVLGALLRESAPRRVEPGAAAQRALQLTWVRPLGVPRDDAAPTAPAPAAKTTTLRAKRTAGAIAAPVVVQTIAAPVASTPPRDAAPDGSVFGLPQIAFASARAPVARGDSEAGATAMQIALLTQQRSQAAAAHDAARAQLHAALQRELGGWPVLDRAAKCQVRADGADCDDDALRAQLLTRADALQALLAALRQFEPGADALTIEFRDGRYHGAAQRSAAL
jgi:hypothetical protein